MILGNQWKNENASTKAHFKSMAYEIKQKHHEDHPGYQYQPRKPSEKKRRWTRRKAGALAEAANPIHAASASDSTETYSMEDVLTAKTSLMNELMVFEEPGEEVVWKELADGDMALDVPTDADAFAMLIDEYNDNIATHPPSTETTAVYAGLSEKVIEDDELAFRTID